VRAQRVDRLLLLDADDAAARAGHADVGDVGRPAWKDAPVGCRDVRVGADDGRHAAIEVPAHGDLLAGRLGVHVDEHVVGLAAQLLQDLVDLQKRHAARAQEDVAAEIDHPEPHAVVLDHDPAAPWLGAQVVRRPDDRVGSVQVRVDVTTMERVIAQRDDVRPGGEQLVGDLRRDAEPARGVLRVDHEERRFVVGTQLRQEAEQRAATEPADHIAHEEDLHHGPYSRAEP